MAGSGRKVFTAGEVLRAADVNGYLMDQAVQVYAGTAVRGTAVGTAATDGMMSYLQDTNRIEVYKTSGTAIAGWETPYPISPNVILNGDFSINQRNFSSTTTDGIFGFDRWRLTTNNSVAGTCTYSLQTFTPGAAPVAGYESKNFARLLTSGQSSVDTYSILVQRIEDVRTFANQTVTVSFWAKASSGTPKIALEIERNFGSGGSPSSGDTTYFGQTTLSGGSAWTRYYITNTMPSVSSKTIGTTDNTSYSSFNFWVSAGSNFNSRTGSIGVQNNTFDIWGVQVEAGQTATPFRRNANSIQAELAACQRYYWRISDTGNVGTGSYTAATTIQGFVQFPVPMRIAPSNATVESSNVLTRHYSGGTAAITSMTFSNSTVGSSIYGTSGSRTTNDSLTIYLNAGYLGFSAEL